MKHLVITYHMTKSGEGAETCITLPMMDKIAEDILKEQRCSPYVFLSSAVDVILTKLAALQGYVGAEFCYAEEKK